MEIKEEIKNIIKNCLELDEFNLKDSDNLIENFSINSIDAIGIFLAIEETFDIQIADEDLGVELIESVNSMARYITQRKK